jgi:FkbM family methyltransferase
MTQLHRELTNLVARSLRTVRRAIAPGLDTRQFALGRAYGRFMHSAARLDYVDDVNGHRMYLDDRDSLRLSVARVLEPAETHYFQSTLRPGDVAIDVGANIGYYTLLFAKCVGAAGHVHSFEPDPTNFGLLSRNVAHNGYGNVTLHHRAVWSERSELRLYLSDENRGDHRSYASEEARASIAIEAVRLDDALAELPRVDLVKMDIQGAEHHALRGMQTLLERNLDVRLAMEFWPGGLARAGASAEALLDLLTDMRFAFLEIRDDTMQLRPIQKSELLARIDPTSDDFINLVCLRAH